MIRGRDAEFCRKQGSEYGFPGSRGKRLLSANNSALGVPGLALTAHRKHEGGICWRYVAVQHHVPGRAAADNQLTQAAMHGLSDQGMLAQHLQRADDQPDARRCLARFVFEQVIEDAVEVSDDFRRKLDPAHALRLGARAAGRRAGLPAARACR